MIISECVFANGRVVVEVKFQTIKGQAATSCCQHTSEAKLLWLTGLSSRSGVQAVQQVGAVMGVSGACASQHNDKDQALARRHQFSLC